MDADVPFRLDKITVIGIGDIGCGVVDRLLAVKYLERFSWRAPVRDVQHVAADWDAARLAKSLAPVRIFLQGAPSAYGTAVDEQSDAWGAVRSGFRSPDEQVQQWRDAKARAEGAARESLLVLSRSANLACIVAGLGMRADDWRLGELAKWKQPDSDNPLPQSLGLMAVRQGQGHHAIAQLEQRLDTLVLVPLEDVRHLVGESAGEDAVAASAEAMIAEALRALLRMVFSVKARVYTDPSVAEPLTLLRTGGAALLGLGVGRGEFGPQEATREALSSPLLSPSIAQADRILFILNGTDMADTAVEAARAVIQVATGAEATIRGVAVTAEDAGDEVRIVLLALGGFDRIDELAVSAGSVLRRWPPSDDVPAERQPARAPGSPLSAFEIHALQQNAAACWQANRWAEGDRPAGVLLCQCAPIRMRQTNIPLDYNEAAWLINDEGMREITLAELQGSTEQHEGESAAVAREYNYLPYIRWHFAPVRGSHCLLLSETAGGTMGQGSYAYVNAAGELHRVEGIWIS